MSLNKIQSELHAPKQSKNKFGNYNYRTIEQILENLKPILLKYDATLTITDDVFEVGGLVYVEAKCTLVMGDKEYITKAQAGVDLDQKGMNMSQKFGSASSYARKYCCSAMFLCDGHEADADATNDHKHTPKVDKDTEERNKLRTQLSKALTKNPEAGKIELPLTDEIKTVGQFYQWSLKNLTKGKIETFEIAVKKALTKTK